MRDAPQRAGPRQSHPRRHRKGTEHPAPVRTSQPTPIYISSRTRLILIFASLVLAIGFAYAAPSVVQLVLIGGTLALILSFPVRLLSRVMRRGVAIALVMTSVILLALVALVVLVPFLILELTRLFQSVPAVAADLEQLAERVLQELWERGLLPMTPAEVLDRFRAGLFDRAAMVTQTLLDGALGALAGTLDFLISAFGVVFLTTYFLVDVRRFKAFYLRCFAYPYRDDAVALWDTLDESLSRYLSGLLLSITIQGTMAGVALWLIGVPYPVALGLWMAVTALVPYLGAFLGAIPAVVIALTISFPTAALTALVYLAINQLEGNFLTPRIQGEAVRVHPVLIFLSIVAGGQLAGILGVVLAVPTLAVLRVLADFFAVRLRVQSPEPTVMQVPQDDMPDS